MKCNVGKTDRIFRVIAGGLLIGAGYYTGGTAGCVMSIVGLVPLLTGMAGYCPAYTLFKIDSCKPQ
jgi:hypothetical protein